jgi:hypothetical protein
MIVEEYIVPFVVNIDDYPQSLMRLWKPGMPESSTKFRK